MLAVMHGKTGCMEKLIQAGANVCYASFYFFYANIKRILRGRFCWRKCCIGSDCVDSWLLNQGIDTTCSCNVSDIDV